MKYLLDTSVVIDNIRRKDKRNSLLFKLANKKHQLLASIITHTELYSGHSVWENERAKSEVETILSSIKLLPITINISQKAGFIIYKHKFQKAMKIDAVIAATSLSHKLPLATLNKKHFSPIKGLKLA